MLGRIVLLCGFVAACGGDDDGSQTSADAAPGTFDADPSRPDADRSSFPVQMVFDACAPDDGGATTVLLGDARESSECRVAGIGMNISITVFTRAISAPRTITLSDQTGQATFCLGGTAPCLFGTGGTITFETFERDVGASGSYQLQFGDTTEAGTFDAEWCDSAVICG